MATMVTDTRSDATVQYSNWLDNYRWGEEEVTLNDVDEHVQAYLVNELDFRGLGTVESVEGPHNIGVLTRLVPTGRGELPAEYAIRTAIAHLRVARDLLKAANAPKATEKVRKALKSAEGAQRHAEAKVWDV